MHVGYISFVAIHKFLILFCQTEILVANYFLKVRPCCSCTLHYTDVKELSLTTLIVGSKYTQLQRFTASTAATRTKYNVGR